MPTNPANPAKPAKPKTKKATAASTSDGFANLIQRSGYQADNSYSAGTYGPSELLTDNRIKLEWMYRQNWIAGGVVDSIAEDMVRSGIDIIATTDPQQVMEMQTGLTRLGIWDALLNCIKWSRLYGGSLAVLQLEGQDLSTPLRVCSIGKDQFRGLSVYDRWQVEPDLTRMIQSGPNIGLPEYYMVVSAFDDSGQPTFGTEIHYSRCVRMIGIQLPFFQAITEDYWGESVLERIYDRMLAFDTATMGAANLLDKVHLRTIGIENLREILAMGGPAEENLMKMFTYVRQMQTNEGITLLDSKDVMQTSTYSFAGMGDMIQQFAQQVAGATQIPITRLMGQSPAGLSATGEHDMRMYYDNIYSQQESRLRSGMETILKVLHQSLYGLPAPEEMSFTFRSLWQMSATEKANNAKTITETVIGAMEAGLITTAIGMQELRQASEDTGVFTNIAPEDIEEEEELPPMPRLEEEKEQAAESPQDLNALDRIKRWLSL